MALEHHLIPFFGEHPLTAITIAEVDRYKAAKLGAGRLSPRAINMTLILLSAILEVAEERELLPRNPARGRRRRVKESAPNRRISTGRRTSRRCSTMRAGDREAREDRQHIPRRAILATLTYAGLRIGELVDLRWRDVDLAAGRLRVGRAKTAAGVRHVRLRPALRDELAALKARTTEASPISSCSRRRAAGDWGKAPCAAACWLPRSA